MAEVKQAYPLSWPEGWKRTPASLRKSGRFTKDNKWLTVSQGVTRVLTELERLGVNRNDLVISTNVMTRLDGLPRSDQKEPSDPGAAAYWRESHGKPMRCMAIDRYVNVADNLAAIAATLEAMRAIERHGGAEILDRAFTGFAALPASTEKHWREVFGFTDVQRVTAEDVTRIYRGMAASRHPDSGGSHEAMAELNVARTSALKELAGQ